MTQSDNALRAPVRSLRGVGPKLEARLTELGICSVEDLLYHFPLRYQDRTQVTAIGGLRDGVDAIVHGAIRLASVVPGRRRSLVVKLEDASGLLTLRFFHFHPSQVRQLQTGVEITLFGQARWLGGGFEMVHPEYRLQGPEAFLEPSLTPVYPTVEGIGQSVWRNLLGQSLALLAHSDIPDLLADIGDSTFSAQSSITFLHRPPRDAATQLIRDGQHPAQQRLALEELVAHNLSLQALRNEEKSAPAPALQQTGSLTERFFAGLPFQPTRAQTRVVGEIVSDMGQPSPMLRLVQGDVGSGKTLVAAVAALVAMEAGAQVALMAPTELLAEQHLQTFRSWLQPLGVAVTWLSGSVKGTARRDTLDAIAAGQVSLVVGTHALFQEGVSFASLGLVIVDEQHRFGVHQRLTLTEKALLGQVPHQLVLTATPIPRTLSMVAYADLDCSVIDELPPGRTPVSTTLIDSQRRDEVIRRVGVACREGRQAYWVCTLIDESETLPAQAAETNLTTLQDALPDLRVGLIHGRMRPAEKEQAMAAFKQGETQILVATTVIEVGVDVPNASLMIIENPERLGLAQLHQLRGRVGRGATASHCLLLYQSPLGEQGKQRLEVMRCSTDGFYIAEQDLRLRGPGELLGTRQTGLAAFRVAKLPEHENLLETVASTVQRILADHPDRAQALIDRWTGPRQAFARV